MATLPIRFSVLRYMDTVKKACADDAMNALKGEYGTEKQFTRLNFLDHLMTLKENGLLEDAGADFNSKNELCVYYSINADGKDMLTKYVNK